MYLPHVKKKCIMLTAHNYIRAVKFGGECNTKFYEVCEDVLKTNQEGA